MGAFGGINSWNHSAFDIQADQIVRRTIEALRSAFIGAAAVGSGLMRAPHPSRPAIKEVPSC